ncbi:MAG: helix-hairpin-helix domain-containing protein [Acidobacteriota bacterium]|nr:helix-hairpin-helix domain-containing protein [Acidobacteriota bacterium]
METAVQHLTTMRRTLLSLSSLLLAIGCSPASRSPDAVRNASATVTAAAARNAKAVAQGVLDGLSQKGPVNLNRASAEDLQTLPGIEAPAARRIIAGRPYENSAELVKRRILTKQQYDRIAIRVKTR